MASTPRLQLGLIGCKVKATPATDKPAGNSNICDNGHPATKAKMSGGLTCPTCSGSPTGKGRELADGTLVPIDQADLDAAAADATPFKATVNLTPHPAEQMTEMLPAPEGKVYVLAPHAAAEANTYALLLALVGNHPELCFTAIWAYSTVPAMYRLGVYRDRLTLTELAWPDAIRSLPAAGGTVDAQLLPMAEMFLTTLTTPFDPSTYRNTGRDRLEAIIAAGGSSTSTTTSVVMADAVNLMAQLQAAVTAATAASIAV